MNQQDPEGNRRPGDHPENPVDHTPEEHHPTSQEDPSCAVCGAAISQDDIVCPNCGTSLVAG